MGVKSFDLIKLISRIGKGFPGASKLGRRLLSLNFANAVNQLYKGSILAENVLGGSLVGSVFLFLLTTFFLAQILNVISSVISGLSFALFFILLINNSIHSKYDKEITSLEKVIPYLLEEISSIYHTTGSIFEALLYVSRGDYGVMSSRIAEMIEPMNQGIPPEQLLEKLALNQPSQILRRGLLACTHSLGLNSHGLDAIIEEAHQSLQHRFERLTLQWESRMMIFVGLLVFLPLIVILGVSIRGLAGSPFILILPVLQYGLSGILQHKLLPKDLLLVGEERGEK